MLVFSDPTPNFPLILGFSFPVIAGNKSLSSIRQPSLCFFYISTNGGREYVYRHGFMYLIKNTITVRILITQ